MVGRILLGVELGSCGMIGCHGSTFEGGLCAKKAKNVKKYAQNPAEIFTNGAFFRKNRLFSHKISLIWVGFYPATLGIGAFF